MSEELSKKMRRILNEIKAFEHSEEVRCHRQMAEQDTLTNGREQDELREKLEKAMADLRYCQGQLEKAEVYECLWFVCLEHVNLCPAWVNNEPVCGGVIT